MKGLNVWKGRVGRGEEMEREWKGKGRQGGNRWSW